MPIEQQAITDKLLEEGIAENLGNGLSFETADALDAWVNTFKESLPETKKGLDEYTKEELEEIAKDPQFKGNKGLQGFLDQMRSNIEKPTSKKPESKKPEENSEVLDLIQKLNDRFDEQDNKRAEATKTETATALIKKTFTEQTDVDLVLRLSKSLEEADIKEAITLMTDRLKVAQPNFVPGGGVGKPDKTSDVLNKWSKKQEKNDKSKK